MAIKKIKLPPSRTSKSPKVLVIIGPTSGGKTKLGVELAAELDGEIISADSRQVYRGMDIGTGKDLAEYRFGRKKIKHHLIDVASPQTRFDLAKYQRLAFQAIQAVLSRGRLPIVVGGSGLNLQAVVDNFHLASVKPDTKKRALWEKLSVEELFKKISQQKPDFAARLNNSERHNQRRLIRYLEIIEAGGGLEADQISGQISKEKEDSSAPYNFLILGLSCPIEVLKIRIKERLEDRLNNQGLIEEVKRLHQEGVAWRRLISFGLEYKFVSLYLQGKLSREQLLEKLNIALGQFAKRQKTWFRRWEKQGKKITWLSENKLALVIVKKWLKN